MFFVSKFVAADLCDGGVREIRHGRMTKNLDTAKRLAKKVSGVVRDDQRRVIAQAVFPDLEGNYIK